MDKLVTYDTDWNVLQELDLGAANSVPLTFSIAEVRKAGAKGGSFSKTIKLPGTNVNNKFFGGIYDVNTSYDDFNPNKKVFVKLTVSGSELISGHMKLTDLTTNDKGDIVYNVTLVDTGVTLWSQMGDELVIDLPLDNLTHKWSHTNIVNSWDSDWNTGTVENVDENGVVLGNVGGIFYPLLNGSSSSTIVTTVGTNEMLPAVFHKTLLDATLTRWGYTWGGSLKTDSVYEREILPRAIRPAVPSQDLPAKFKQGLTTTDVLQFVPNAADGKFVHDGVQGVNFNSEANIPYGFHDVNNVYDIDTFTAPSSGSYALNINILAEVKVTILQTGEATTYTPYHKTQMRLIASVYNELGVLQTPSHAPFTDIGAEANNEFTPVNTNGVYVMEDASTGQIPEVSSYTTLDVGYLPEDYTVVISIEPYSPEGVVKSSNGDPATDKYQIVRLDFNMLAGSYVESTLSDAYYGEDSVLTAGSFINSTLKQSDLFKDILARYNLYIYPDPNIANHLILDTGGDFLSGSVYDAIDWSDKKDPNTPDKITHVGELTKRKLLLTYKAASDLLNKNYKENTGEVWGEYEYTFDNDYVTGIEKVETPFEPTPNTYSSESLIVPAINYGDASIKQRVLYAVKGGVDGNMRLLTEASLSILTKYPYAGHVADPLLPEDVIDINFGNTAKTYAPEGNYQSTNTLEARHWRNKLDQLGSGKLLTTRFNLTAHDAYTIRQAPNNKIWVNNAYWYVNKMSFEGNSELRGLTKVELVTAENITKGKRSSGVTGGGHILGGNSTGTSTSGTNTIHSTSNHYTISGTNNTVGSNTNNISISGNSNTVNSGSSNITISSSSEIEVTGSNVTVIGSSGLIITSSNVTIIDNVLQKNGETIVLFNVLDGGVDELRALGSVSNINLADGGLNANANPFNVQPIDLITGDGTEITVV